MTPMFWTSLALLPAIAAIVLILIGRPLENNLKLLIVLFPLQAFAVIEAGFSITLAYLLLVIMLLSLLLKGETFAANTIGSRLIYIFLVVATVATIFGMTRDYQTSSTTFGDAMRFRAGGMRTFLQYGLLLFHFSLFFVVTKTITSAEKAISLLKVHLTVGMVLIGLGIAQMAAFILNLPGQDFTWAISVIPNATTASYGEVRLYSAGVANFATRTTFRESLHYADYLNSVLPILIAFWISKNETIKKQFGFLATPYAALLGIVAMFFTLSRSGWGALAVSVIVLIICLSPRVAYIHLPITAAVSTVTAALMVKLGFFSFGAGSLTEIITGRFDLTKILFGPRAQYFVVLFEHVKEYPLWGAGAGQFALLGAARTGSEQVHSAHGILWAALADFGAIGFLVLLLLLSTIAYHLYRTARTLPASDPLRTIMIGMFAALCGLYFQSLFYGDRIQFYLLFLLALSAVLTQFAKKKLKTEHVRSNNNRLI